MSTSGSGKALVKAGVVAAFTIGVLGGTMQAHAQSSALVNVDLRNARILNNVANDLSIAVQNVPVTVQVPVSVAANVCRVQIAVLATAFNQGGASCYAQSTSAALNRFIQRVVNLQ